MAPPLVFSESLKQKLSSSEESGDILRKRARGGLGWGFSHRRIERRMANPLFTPDPATCQLYNADHDDEDLRLMWGLRQVEDSSHVGPSPDCGTPLPRVNSASAEVPGKGGLPQHAPSSLKAVLQGNSFPEMDILRPLLSPQSSMSQFDRIGASGVEGCAGSARCCCGGGSGCGSDGWRLAEMERVAQRLADELAGTRSQLITAVQLALTLSQQLDRCNVILGQGNMREPIMHTACNDMAPTSPAEAADSCDAHSCAELSPEGAPEERAKRQLSGGKSTERSASEECEVADSWESEAFSEGDTDNMMRLMESEDGLCLLCHNHNAAVVTLPCRHLVLCKGCAGGAVECPKCLACMHGVFHLAD